MKKLLRKIVMENYDEEGNRIDTTIYREDIKNAKVHTLENGVRLEFDDTPDCRTFLYNLGVGYDFDTPLGHPDGFIVLVLTIPSYMLRSVSYDYVDIDEDIIDTGI